MESLLGRYRNLIILVGVLFLQLLGLAVQVKRSDTENTRVIRVWAVDAITPFESALVSLQNSCANVWHNYFYLRGVRAENRQLKEQIEQMRLEQVRLSQDAEQAHRLQALLGFKEQMVAKTVAAQVIGSSPSDLSRIITIDKGENANLKPDMAVVTADGIVGKILLVSPSASQVLLINDQSSGVGVILEKSRLQGVLLGTPNGEIVLRGVMSDEQVTPGERVLSSGGDQIFPKGMPVGTVSKVSPGKDLFLDIKVRPSANLGRLEEVLVVTEKREREAVAENGAKVRAADILAQRLPSVPDKPATEAEAPGKAASSAESSAVGPVGARTGASQQPTTGIKPQGSATPGVSAGPAKPAENPGTKSLTTTPTAAMRDPAAAPRTPSVVSADGPIATPRAAVEKTASPGNAGANGSTAATTQASPSQATSSQTKAASPAAQKATPQSAAPNSATPKPAAPSPNQPPSQDGPH